MKNDELGRKIGDVMQAATQSQFAGDTATALKKLEEIEAPARSAGHPGLVFILTQKAGWLRELGRTKDAQSALAEAVVRCQESPEGKMALPGVRMEQGIVARQAGDLPQAESFLNEAHDLVKGSPMEVLMMSDILANLSTVYSDQGKLEQAQTVLLAALKYDEQTGDSRAMASNLNMLGLLYDRAGDRKSAKLYLTHSKEIAAEAGLAKETADAIHNLATLADEEGQDNARAGFLEALESAERSGRRPEIASAKTSLAILESRAGNHEKARDMLLEAYGIHSELGLAEFRVNDLINLTENAIALQDPDAALNYGKEALQIAEKHGLVQVLWAVHYCLAHAQSAVLKARQLPDAKSINAMLSSYEKSADAIELMRSGIGRPEERQQLLINKEMVYQEAMILAGILEKAHLAWNFAERSRGRAFLDSLGEKRIGHQAEKHPLSIRRAELTNQLLALKDDDGEKSQPLVDELRMVRTLISAQAPNVAALTETDLPKIEEIAALIPPDSAILEFYLGPRGYLTIFVLNQKGLVAMNSAHLGKLDLPGTIEQFRAELQYEVPDEPTGYLLFNLLCRPVWHYLDQVGRLFIVPHRELNYLPFAAVWYKNVGEGPEHLYLCQRFQISVIPSASYFALLTASPQPQSESGSSLVMGNPTGDLPGSALEASAVAELLGVKPTIGAEALRDRVLQMEKRNAVVHIASHGVYERRDPLLSGLLLADGRLSVEDLLDAQIPTDLLTLSGCLTGISSEEPGDELTGLTRAALSAGVPSVITTLWEVGDDPTREFFVRFYRHLQTGMNKDTALAVTQQSMIGDEKYSRPANWAPYVLLGDCR